MAQVALGEIYPSERKTTSFNVRRASALQLYHDSEECDDASAEKRFKYAESISGPFEEQTKHWNNFLKTYPQIGRVFDPQKYSPRNGMGDSVEFEDIVEERRETEDSLRYTLMKWKNVYETKTTEAARKDYGDDIHLRTGRLQSLYRTLRTGASRVAGATGANVKMLPKVVVDKLQKLVRNGVPPALRGKVWQLCTGSGLKREEAAELGQSYEALNHSIRTNIDIFPSQSWIDIDKDVRRTVLLLADNKEYPDEYRPCLQRVLVAYALRNPELGYCQGMSTLVALLLLHMGEEDAFWVLSAIVEDMMPRFYATDMGGIKAEASTFEFLFRTYLPKLHSRISPLGVPVKPFAIKWFLCLYVNSLSVSIALRVWDCFFYEGVKVLHRVGLAALSLQQKSILSSEANFSTVYESLDRSTMECKDVEKLMKASYGPLFTGKNFSSKLLLKVRRHVLKHDTDFFEGKTADEVDRDALEKMSCASPSSMRYCSDHPFQ